MIDVLVAENVSLIREALARLLSLEDDIEVVAGVASGDEIVSTAVRHRPDVAVIDIALPKLDVLATAAELHRRLPSCKALILSSVVDPATLRRAVAQGIAGFMLKESTLDDLIDRIRTVAAGGYVIDAPLAYAALSAPDNPLTDRESDVLRLTADGWSTREVAGKLFLSHGTVRNYLASVVTKLGARNRIDAVRVAGEAGWL